MGKKHAVSLPYTDYFASPVCLFNLNAPTGVPIYTEQKALVKFAWGGGRTDLRNRPARHRVLLPGGQRRAQPYHVTRRCDFPRLAQDAHPDGRIGVLDEWPAPLRGLGAARRRNLGPGEDFE